MHIQIITYNLKGISEEDYLSSAEPAAPALAALPGLVSKTWLANSETNTYAGLYVWENRDAMEAYAETDLFKWVATNPNFENVTVTDFAILENPTRITRGLVEAAV